MLLALRLGNKKYSYIGIKCLSTLKLRPKRTSEISNETRSKVQITPCEHAPVSDVYLSELQIFPRNTKSSSLHTALVEHHLDASGDTHDHSICSRFPSLHFITKHRMFVRTLSNTSHSYFQKRSFKTSHPPRKSKWTWVRRIVFVFVVMALGIGLLVRDMHSIYSSLPEGVEEPEKLTFIKMTNSLGVYIANIMKFFQLGNFHNNLRRMFEMCSITSAEPADVQVSRAVLAGVPVVISRPTCLGDQPAPAVIFFHGGGFVVGSANSYSSATCCIAKETQSVVVSVDYRLAPEHPFPAAPEDCLKVTRHVLQHGLDLGVDVTNVGVVGTSAGGNLAAVVALQLSKENTDSLPLGEEKSRSPPTPGSLRPLRTEYTRLPPLKFQVLYYPLLQAVDFSTPSHINNNDATSILLTRDYIGYYLALYFGIPEREAYAAGEAIGSNKHIPKNVRNAVVSKFNIDLLPEEFRKPPAEDTVLDVDLTLYSKIRHALMNPLFCPLIAYDVSNVPPTFILGAEFDTLLDDGLMYLAKLERDGVRVQGHVSRGGFHGDGIALGHDWLQTEGGKEALRASYEFIRREFES